MLDLDGLDGVLLEPEAPASSGPAPVRRVPTVWIAGVLAFLITFAVVVALGLLFGPHEVPRAAWLGERFGPVDVPCLVKAAARRPGGT